MLSEPLRDQISSHIQGGVLKKYQGFNQYEENFISQLSRTLYIETFGPDDKVFEQGEISSKMYFI